MSASDCIVIGGGVVGLLTARDLDAAGMQVMVVERARTGLESSWAGGGVLMPLPPWELPARMEALCRHSRQLFPSLVAELQEESGVDPQWRRSGLLVLDLPDPAAALAWSARTAERAEVLGPVELQRRQAGLADAGHQALWFPDVEQVRNPRLLQALRRSLEHRGVEIREGLEVTRIRVRAGRVSGVETRGENLAAARVVVAAGAWSPSLLDPLGPGLAVQPVRGQMLLFPPSATQVGSILLKGDIYVIPRADGRLLVGSTVEQAGFDKSVTASGERILRRGLETLLPALAHAPLEARWAGLRPGSPEGVPFISPWPGVDGLFVNAGHFRNGLLLAPGSARLCADLVLGRRPELDASPYRVRSAGAGALDMEVNETHSH